MQSTAGKWNSDWLAMGGLKANRGKLPVISLFSGAMGLDLGLEAAGLEIVVALECNKNALATIRKNRPNLPLIDRPIEDVTTKEILELAGLKPGEAFAVVGGPSCQVFSTAGSRRSLADPRSTMFRHFVRVIREAKPQFYVMENVRGLISAAVRHRPLNERGPGFPPLEEDEELGSAFKAVTASLKGLGYYSIFDILNSADYGVPQTRHRLVILGSRDGKKIRMPEATHDELRRKRLRRWQTLGEALKGGEDEEPEFYTFCPAKERYLRLVPEGGNWRDLPARMKRYALGSAFDSWGGRSGFFRRLSMNEPSPALTTRPDSKATTLCHPTELRPLSVGEYARIQQFPKGWQFEGSIRRKYEQVGNAVPIGLGKAIGKALRDASRKHPNASRLRRIECFNLDLLSKLSRRPRTIVNPPRMRISVADETISDWHGEESRMRDDAFGYVARELLSELREMVEKRPRPARSIKNIEARVPNVRSKKPRVVKRPTGMRRLRLDAAE
jgi:DNA (cytosine-5)-methyltransferase 1